MNDLQRTGLVEETQALLGGTRKVLIKVAENLYQIKNSGEWEGYAASWGEFSEGTLGISQSMASKLISNYEKWVVEAGIPAHNLENVDYECLYLAAPLLKETNALEALAQAKTLSRAELRQNRQEKEPHSFEAKEICRVCGGAKETHA